MEEQKKTVCLVGMAQTTRDLAKWDDESIEIWTLNESPAKRFGYVKRVSRHFQLHPKWNYDRPTNQNDPEHADWLRAQKDFPIYMQEVDPDIPASVKYPLEEVFEHFNVNTEIDHWREFTSTFPYMMALALYEGFDRIEIYGFEMGSETEYAYQRSSAHLWLGIARGLYLTTGKPELYIPDGSRLLGWGMDLYGYDLILGLNPMELEIDRNKFAIKEKEVFAKIAEIQGAQDEITKQLQGIAKKYDAEIKELQQKKTDPKLRDKRIKEKIKQHDLEVTPLKQRLSQLDSEKLNMSQQLNYIKGMKDNTEMNLQRYHAQLPKIPGPDFGVQLRK